MIVWFSKISNLRGFFSTGKQENIEQIAVMLISELSKEGPKSSGLNQVKLTFKHENPVLPIK